MKRILSGVQPTGNLHLGNYLGAICNWVAMQHEYESLFMLADLHAITVPQDPAALRKSVRETAAAYIACGVDPKKSVIFPQSAISAHSELAWILSCHTPLGWLDRMTQFKDKIGVKKVDIQEQAKKIKTVLKHARKKGMLEFYDTEKASFAEDEFTSANVIEIFADAILDDINKRSKANLGLYSYPVLMAADILAYKATHVPVGHDQKQHLELCRDIAGAFNRAYNPSYNVKDNIDGFFPLPEPVIMGEAARIMSLRDGTKKMSKSDESDYSRINLTDDADTIVKKFKKATSDSLPTVGENIENRPEALNLVTIYASFKGIKREQAVEEFRHKNFSALKQQLADVAVEKLSPITKTMRELLESPDYIDKVLAEGAAKAQAIAGKTMSEVKGLVGFLEL